MNQTPLRVYRSREAARAAYDRLSRHYDWISGWAESPYRKAGLRALSAAPGERILEIGFGTGRSLVDIGRSVGASGAVIGVDLSGGMVDVAQTRLQRSEMGRCVALVQADGAYLPLYSACVDAVFMSFTLELFDTPEIPHVLAECCRVLRRDGRLVVVSLQRPVRLNLMVRVYEWAHGRFPQTIDCRPIYVRRALESAGFSIDEALVRRMFGLPVAIVSARLGSGSRVVSGRRDT